MVAVAYNCISSNSGTIIDPGSVFSDRHLYVYNFLMQANKEINISKGKKFLLLFVCVVVFPVATLLLLEVLFGILAPGAPNKFFIKGNIPGKASVFRANYRFAKRFFPANLGRKPLPEIFPAKRTKKTFRAFILGESAARGEFLADFSFSRMLEAVLKKNNPDKNIEIINTGIPAINSWVITEIANELVDYQPDLVIIYAGNNEFIGPYGPASIFSGNSGRLAAKLGIFASSLDLIKALKSDQLPKTLKKGWQGLEMFFENRIAPNSKLIETCIENWQKNLKEILQPFKKNSIPTLICSVPANLKDCPPFMSVEISPESTKKLDILKTAYSNNNWDKIIEIFDKNSEIFKNHALANWLKAEAKFRQNNYKEALNLYKKSLNLDCFRVRTNTEMNKISEKISTEFKSGFLDLIPIFNQNSQTQICGKDLIYDHVHLTFKGHFLAAKSIYKFIANNHEEKNLNFSPDFPDLSQMAQLIAFTDNDRIFNLSNIIAAMKEKPFVLQINNAQTIKRLTNELKKLNKLQNTAEDIYATTQALEKFPEDWHFSHRLANLYMQTGQLQEAIAYFNKTLKQNPFNINSLNNAGTLYLQTKSFKQAAELFNRAIELAPNFADAFFNLALCAGKKHNSKKAIALYQKTLAINPAHTNSIYNLANIYFSEKNYKKALSFYKRVININPQNLNALAGAANSFEKLNQPQKAMELYENSIKKHPHNPISHYNIGLAYEKRKNINQAVKHYQNALKLNFSPAASRVVNLLAQNPDKIDRDTQLKLSLESCRVTKYKDPYCLQALASAYAAENQLQKAASTLHTAFEIASTNNKTRLANDIKASLKIINNALKK